MLSSLTGKGQEDVGHLAGSVNHDLTDLGQGLRPSHTCVPGPRRSLISGWQDFEMSTGSQAKEDPVESVGWGLIVQAPPSTSQNVRGSWRSP